MPVAAAETGTAVASVLATALKGVSLAGITTEITGALPVVLPVSGHCLALAEGYLFLDGDPAGLLIIPYRAEALCPGPIFYVFL